MRAPASTWAGDPPEGVGGRLNTATGSMPAVTLAAHLTTGLGVPATVEGTEGRAKGRSPQEAWAAGSWAVAHAEADGITSVTVGDRMWTRARGAAAWSWQAAKSTEAQNSVTITRM